MADGTRNGVKKNNKTGAAERPRLIPASTIMLFFLAVFAAFIAAAVIAKGILSEGLEFKERGVSVLESRSRGAVIADDNGYGDYVRISEDLAALSPTHTEWTNFAEDHSQNGLAFIATVDEGRRMVYNVDPDDLCGEGYSFADFNYIWVDSVNTGFFCVINIPGEVVDLTGYYILVHDDTGNLASRLVINCFEAKAVILKDAVVTGTLLAPGANVEYGNTVVYGGVYAKASTGSRAYYRQISFSGYSVILRDSKKVTFTNVIMRSVTLAWLKANIPGEYAGYPADYVPDTIDLARITSLGLDGQYIADMAGDLEYLVNLESLSLRRTKLKSLDVSRLSKLKYLDVGDTEISEVLLPESGSLETLIADNSALKTLDTSRLGGALKISLKNVKTEAAPDYSKLVSAVEINLSGAGIGGQELAVLGRLPALRTLDVSGNRNITELDLGAFETLETLNVSECAIAEITAGEETALKEIDISYNPLKNADLSAAGSLTRVNAYGEFESIRVADAGVVVSKLPATKVIY